MKLTSSLRGRLKNTTLPNNRYFTPIFEALSNSIHALEESARDGVASGIITLEILRQPLLEGLTKGSIEGVRITDKGCGFTNKNFESFITLDSDYKKERGGKGIGRIYYLKVFKQVHIESIYKEKDNTCYRCFEFSAEQEVFGEELKTLSAGEQCCTSITLKGIRDEYTELTKKSAEDLAKALLAHFLYYFASPKNALDIHVIDEGAKISLKELFTITSLEIKQEETEIEGDNYSLVHLKLAPTKEAPSINLCAHNRVVENKKLTKDNIEGLETPLCENGKTFTYKCYAYSEYFDKMVGVSRLDFVLEAPEVEGFKDKMGRIIDKIVQQCSVALSAALEEHKLSTRQQIIEYIDTQEPQYKPLKKHLKNCPVLSKDPKQRQEQAIKFLAVTKAELSVRIAKKAQEIQKLESTDLERYKERAAQIYKDSADLNMCELASYVVQRKVIIDMLENSIKNRKKGGFAYEAKVHELLMPLKCESNDEFCPYDNLNLWLLDERLVFHRYIASDLPLKQAVITDSQSPVRPDLLIQQTYTPKAFSNQQIENLNSITIVELKRPQRDDYKAESNPVNQVLSYVRKLRESKIRLADGRLLPNRENMPFYAYILADLTPSLEEALKMSAPYLTKMADGSSYLGYHPNYNLYIEVIDYNSLLYRTKERNKTFFDKLGLF